MISEKNKIFCVYFKIKYINYLLDFEFSSGSAAAKNISKGIAIAAGGISKVFALKLIFERIRFVQKVYFRP